METINERQINLMLEGGKFHLTFEIKNKDQANYIMALWGAHNDDIPKLKVMKFEISYKRRFLSSLLRLTESFEKWLRSKVK